MVRIDRHYEPNEALAVHYDRRYALYRDMTEAMTPLWRRLSASAEAASGVVT